MHFLVLLVFVLLQSYKTSLSLLFEKERTKADFFYKKGEIRIEKIKAERRRSSGGVKPRGISLTQLSRLFS